MYQPPASVTLAELIDLAEVIAAKLTANERKYPVKLARGTARKYTELGWS